MRRRRPANLRFDPPCSAMETVATFTTATTCLESLWLLQQLGRLSAPCPPRAHRPELLLCLPAAVGECQQKMQFWSAIGLCHGIIEPGELVKSKVGRHQAGRQTQSV